MENALLTLIVAPAVEDALSDWLLEREDVSGFTSLPVSGHGASPHSMSLAEQVAGRRRQVLFQIHLSVTTGVRLVADLEQSFAGSGIHYWLSPLIEGGHLA